MKLLACIGLGLLLWVGSVQAESDAAIVASRIKLLEAKLPKDHPRLLLRKSELPQFRAFVNALRADKEGAALWKKIAIEPGSIALPDEPEPLPAKKGANGADVARLWRTGYERANDVGNAAWRFALQYLATGDEKYGREAARWLMALVDWRADRAALRNNDEQFIQATRPMIFAYDWAYDALTPAERIKLEQALISRLDLLKTDMDRLFSLVQPTPPNGSISHPMRFISTRGQGGLALFFEQQDAPAHLAWAYEYYNRQFPVWGGAAGGWAEGLDYWSSGLTQHLRFLEGMQLLGFDEPLKRPFFRNNAYFGVYNLLPYPGSSFGDLTNITGPNPNRALLLEKYALLNHDPYPLAFAQQLASRYPDDLGYYTFNAIDTLLHRYRKNQAGLPAANLADLPQSRYFADIGWVTMHSQLGDKSRDIMLTLKSSPYGSASHSHNDQNAFVINAFGEPLAISSGYRDWYDSAHHVGWTRTTQSKNAILIDGKGQPSKDADAKGAIRHFYTGSNYTFASGDASAAYRNLAKSALRHVFFVNRRYFVMLDEVNANADSQFQWLLHAREAMRLDPAAGTVTSSKGQAALRVSFLAPSIDTLKFAQTDAFAVPLNAAFAKGRPNEWHVTVETTSQHRRGEFLTVLYPYQQGDSLPVAQALPVRQGFAVSLDGNDERDVVLLARETERRVDADAGQLQGLAASLSWCNGIPVALTVVEAQSLQSQAVKLTAVLPLTLSARMAETGWYLELQPGPAQEIRLRLPFAPQHVNGVTPDAWRYDVAQQELVLKLGDNVRLIDILK